ncbi:hypothetical protein BJP25_20945 [Actinokineospora bangkokensis]|uniref:HTH marR-type domain-containing protein n=2 Tax=Actinokineospora bangkokensis TaxID=1193682 RepID=A0A1Q9LL48_9PSEU|nr:hypothetical protein BJP25_20945 [Actinokineospora bangkokensis]
MWRRARAAVRDSARTLHPRLDPTVYPLLVLVLHTGPLRMSEAASRLSLDKSTLSRQVDAAVRLALLERVIDPSDARARLVQLTPSGHKGLTALLDDQRSRWRAALAEWDQHEVELLTGLLHKLGGTGVA